MKFDENGEQLVEHHVKYKELHGIDETMWMTNSEHQKLHRKLREEGKCNVPVEELTKIARAAHLRTNKRAEYMEKHNRKYWQDHKEAITEKGKEYHEKHKEKINQYQKKYREENREKIKEQKREWYVRMKQKTKVCK